MLLIHFTALNDQGQLCEETLYLSNKEDLHKHIRERHLTLVSAKRLRAHSFRSIKAEDVAEFLLRLSVLLDAGRPLLGALDDVRSCLSNKRLSYVVMCLMMQLKSGTDLVAGLRQYSKIFDKITIITIDRGMKSGKLAEHIYKAYEHIKQKIAYKNRFKKLTIYPLFLLATMVFMFVGFTQFLLPEVVLYLQEMGIQELPLASRMLIATTHFFEDFGSTFFAGLTVIFLVCISFVSLKGIQSRLTPYLMRLPSLGVFYTRLSVLPWLSTVGELYGVGVDFKSSLFEAKETIDNPYFKDIIEWMNDALLSGVPLNDAMMSSKLFSPFVISLCDLGMKSGNLSTFFKKAHQFEENALHERITKFLSLVEPFLILFMGGLLLWLVMAVILPLYGNLNV